MTEESDGHECPRCGCPELYPRFGATKWGRQSLQFECAHCHKTFRQTVKIPEGPHLYETARRGGVACPSCKAFPWRVRSSPREEIAGVRIRKHRCDRCGYTGKSQEVLRG